MMNENNEITREEIKEIFEKDLTPGGRIAYSLASIADSLEKIANLLESPSETKDEKSGLYPIWKVMEPFASSELDAFFRFGRTSVRVYMLLRRTYMMKSTEDGPFANADIASFLHDVRVARILQAKGIGVKTVIDAQQIYTDELFDLWIERLNRLKETMEIIG